MPSITYFQDLPEPNSINKFFNLTERVIDVSGIYVTIDSIYQTFYTGDDVALVSFDKGKYSKVSQTSYSVVDASGPSWSQILTLNVSSGEIIDTSTDVYIINQTERPITWAQNIDGSSVADIVSYQFYVDQNVAIIVDHSTNGYSWGATYKVTDVSGTIHTFDHPFPQFFIDDPSTYSFKAKHAFTTFAEFQMKTDEATEAYNQFNIYLKDSYCQEYYLDNTFTLVNILFDQDVVNDQWYNSSDNLVNSTFYYHTTPITVDVSTLVILQAKYNPVYLNDVDNTILWFLNSYEAEGGVFISSGLNITHATCPTPVIAGCTSNPFIETLAGEEVILDLNLTCTGSIPLIMLIDVCTNFGIPSTYLSNTEIISAGTSRITLTTVRDSSSAWLFMYTTGITDYSLSVGLMPTDYLLNHKNIWQVTNHDTSTILFKVFNYDVPYIYNEIGIYDVECTAYDSYGNAITKKYEGLLEVKL